MKDNENTNLNLIMQCLGRIEGKLSELSGHLSRQTYALIGIIAAQIGVKVLGTDPLLDVATMFGILGSFLILGFLIMGFRMARKKNTSLTGSGKWLLITTLLILITQLSVYFRDIGLASPRIIYGIRIVMNSSIIMLAWNLMKNPNIVKNNEHIDSDIDSDKDNPCK